VHSDYPIALYYGTTVVYVVRRSPKRRYAAHTCTLKRRVAFQRSGTPVQPHAVADGYRHWGDNNGPHFAVSHQLDGDLLSGYCVFRPVICEWVLRLQTCDL
jgi:hypothetical protein